MPVIVADQAKLVLNTFAFALENSLVTKDAVTFKEMDGEMEDTNNLKVVEQITPRYRVTRTENGVRNLVAGTDGTVMGSELFEVTGSFNVNLGMSDFQRITTIGSFRQNVAATGAVQSLADQIDGFILRAATLAANNQTGNPVNSLSQHLDAMQGVTRLKEEGAVGRDMNFIMNHTDEMLLGDQIIKLPSPTGMTTDTYKNGFNSNLGGVNTLFTNQLPILTTGTRPTTGAATVTLANQFANYATVAVQTTANGLYMSQTMSVSTLAVGATVAVGDIFTLPGVFAYDQRKQGAVTPARLQQFTVIEAATANAGGIIPALRFFPAMIVPGTGVGDNIAINTAHATVTAAPAAGALLTFIGAPATNLNPRIILQKQAIVVNTAPLVLPFSDTCIRRKLPTLPLTVRMWQYSDGATGDHTVRFDIAMNANIRDRRRICRINGA